LLQMQGVRGVFVDAIIGGDRKEANRNEQTG
jgi:hypothetical protein